MKIAVNNGHFLAGFLHVVNLSGRVRRLDIKYDDFVQVRGETKFEGAVISKFCILPVLLIVCRNTHPTDVSLADFHLAVDQYLPIGQRTFGY